MRSVIANYLAELRECPASLGMKAIQNYVSTELTHFVGRSLKKDGDTEAETREKQYALLLKVLRDGWLMCKPGGGRSTGMIIDPYTKLSSNRMIRPNMVCFCDIPLGDLAIHMNKYSPFGLAFMKSHLIEHGANPVFYIAINSKVNVLPVLSGIGKSRIEIRADYFDKQFAEFYDCMRAMKRFLYVSPNKTPETKALLNRAENLENFMSSLFGYFKCFDSSRCENDEENFYMEREWRLTKALQFKLNDVRRLILPKSFVARLKADLPAFTGTISTAA